MVSRRTRGAGIRISCNTQPERPADHVPKHDGSAGRDLQRILALGIGLGGGRFVHAGLHIHQQLIKLDTGKNAFVDEQADYGLSDIGRYFIAGQLAHIKAMCAILSPLADWLQGFVSQVLSGTLTAPFTTSVLTLLYFRLRAAKEPAAKLRPLRFWLCSPLRGTFACPVFPQFHYLKPWRSWPSVDTAHCHK